MEDSVCWWATILCFYLLKWQGHWFLIFNFIWNRGIVPIIPCDSEKKNVSIFKTLRWSLTRQSSNQTKGAVLACPRDQSYRFCSNLKEWNLHDYKLKTITYTQTPICYTQNNPEQTITIWQNSQPPRSISQLRSLITALCPKPHKESVDSFQFRQQVTNIFIPNIP